MKAIQGHLGLGKWSRIVTTCAALVVLGPSSAEGVEAKPFGITKFALQTTASTEIVAEGTKVSGKEIACQPCRIVNVPYVPAFTQAGGHPWALTSTFSFTSEELSGRNDEFGPTRDVKDALVDLPPGLLGNPEAVPRCARAVLLSGSEFCPADTQIGVAHLKLLGENTEIKQLVGPIINLVPEAGQSAEFGLENESKLYTLITAHLVHTPEGYGVTVGSNGIPGVGVAEAELTFWGVPADPSHDPMRGMICGEIKLSEGLFCEHGGESSGIAPVPFLLMPTACSAGPETATLLADAWQEPGVYRSAMAELPGVTGCNLLGFSAGTGIQVAPETSAADEPVGVAVKLLVPQNEQPASNETPQLRDTIVSLPEGMSVSPGIVDGIQACNANGPEGIDIPNGLDDKGEPLQPGQIGEGEERGPNGEPQLAPGHCPARSTVGTAKAFTPLLPVPVEGHVYLARPGCGGANQAACTEHDALDGNLFKLYLELGGTGAFAATGIQFKVPFDVETNPATGQLTTVVQNIMQAPVSEVIVHLNGGPRASLANPGVCGTAMTTADFTPWSAPGSTPEGLLFSGTPDSVSSSFFGVSGCSSPVPFSPGFLAGTVTPQSGQFSAFTLNLSRSDGEQYVKAIQVHTPPGLLGMLSEIPLCEEPLADAGECPESAKIGTTRVASGAGSHPFEIEGGVYLTGPYDGNPFGLSIVVHVAAGPFNLGLKVVRARIAVDPKNATLTVATDEAGPHAIPQIVFGVPVRLKRVTVDIDRPSFMFNPTNCAAQQITARITGSQNAVASVASPFAVGGCKSLMFKPAFSVSTSGKTSRTKGASLDAKLVYPKDAFGNDTNVARVKVDLPKQLPSRLTTLQKACPADVFEHNPGACPPASIVGIAKASTPLLPVGLSGPVYFVSHGGKAFPDLVIVLQGDNLRVDLVGTTFIDGKTGVTSSTFSTIPDVPVDAFELYLPQGKNSALAANGNFCGKQSKLLMPTAFVGQNGAVLKQNTKIVVTGCPAKKAKSARTLPLSRKGR